METRWVLLILTLLCMASCSFLANASTASLLLPIGAAVFGIACVISFINHRLGSVSRGDAALMSDPETLRMLSERAKRAAARSAQPQGGTGAKPAARSPAADQTPAKPRQG